MCRCGPSRAVLLQVFSVILLSRSVGVGSPAGASMSKPAISGRLMMRPPRLAGGGELLGVQGAQRVVLVAAADRDADDVHACALH